MDNFLKDYLDRLEELHQDVAHAINRLPQEALDWKAGKDVPSICVLVTHMASAERYWIGDVAGSVPADRDQDAEFRAAGLNSTDLITLLNASRTFTKGIFEKNWLWTWKESVFRQEREGALLLAGPCCTPWNTPPCTWGISKSSAICGINERLLHNWRRLGQMLFNIDTFKQIHITDTL